MSTVTNDTPPSDLNPTAASLLGYLDLGPMTGWDLDRFVQASIGNFWNVTRSQIYRELRTLTERGYVKAGTTGPRDRVPYAITNAGRKAFKHWIAQPPPPDVIRSGCCVASGGCVTHRSYRRGRCASSFSTTAATSTQTTATPRS